MGIMRIPLKKVQILGSFQLPYMWTKLKFEFTQAKTLLGFAMLQTLGQAASMAVPLVIAWLFSKDMWGRYSLCEPIIFFFSALLILSAKTPFIIFANQERNKTGSIRKTFSIQCIFLVSSILIFLAVVVIFKRPIAAFAQIGVAELFYISLAFFAIVIKDFTGNLFMALNQRTRNAFIELTFGLSTLAFMVLFYLVNWTNLKSVFLSYFLASLVILVVSIVSINFKILLPLVFDRSHFSEMLNFTLWMMAGAVSMYIINWAGTFVLRYSVTIEEVGIYNLAYKFFKGFMVLIYIIPFYFLPHISENIGNAEKINAYLFSKRPRILLLGLVCFALAWVLMPYVLNLLYSDKFNDAVPVIRILIIGCLLFLYTAMYGPIFGALKIYKFQQIASITQVIITVILNFLLIPRFGLAGAATATVLSFFYLAIAIEGYYRWKLKKLLVQSQQA
jgi:O-antigen/teichoic acid export membrane protein